jgi:plastocyanin
VTVQRRFLAAASSLVLLVAGLTFVSCGGDDPAAPPDDGPFTGTIKVLDDRFSPANVTIAVGDSVTWRWEGNHAHTVTQGTTPNASEDPTRLFDSPSKTSGTFGYRFTAAGTVPYFCRPHFAVGMKGTIVVQ